MNMIKTLQAARQTRDDRVVAGIRIALGILFVMTGLMKLAVPTLGAAFGGQLADANIPLASLSRSVVPLVEIGVGTVLLAGYYTRIATLLVYSIMIVATYVHLVVDDPSLFPLQPHKPVVPIVVMVLAAALLAKGGGSKSLDLAASCTAADKRSPGC
ncbi:MAG: DoxX family protein [Gemmatimonadota bacterium]